VVSVSKHATMGKPKTPDAVKIFCGILFENQKYLDDVLPFLEKIFGQCDIRSNIFPFDFTQYYENEMGKNLQKIFVSFEKLLIPENCFEWKLLTNDIEKQFSRHIGKPSRTVNIDPGYLGLSKIVLLTTKDYSHRIYLGKGIYAEVSLIWKQKKFQPLPWTYPDYRTELALKFFEDMRKILKAR